MHHWNARVSDLLLIANTSSAFHKAKVVVWPHHYELMARAYWPTHLSTRALLEDMRESCSSASLAALSAPAMQHLHTAAPPDKVWPVC